MILNKENQIFVSYAHADSTSVKPVVRWLDQNGFNAWIDESIRAGVSWRDELADAIDGSSLVLFFASISSAESEHCRKEITYALEAAKPVVTVFLESVQLPSGLRFALSDLQGIRAFELTEFEFHDQLFRVLQRLIEQHGAKADVTNRPVTVTRSLDSMGHHAPVAVEVSPVIAVLPFTSQSSDPEQQLFSDGISEEILTGLSQQKGLRVIARTSSRQFTDKDIDVKEIGRKLNATHILVGNVRRAGNRVRVNAELIDASNAYTVWSDKYQRDLIDIFEVQDDITSEILAALQLQFQPTSVAMQTNPQAYEEFMAATRSYHRLDFDTAKTHAEQAIELDPGYVSPYAMIAGMHVMKMFYWFASLKEALPTVTYFNKLALSLDPENPVANSVRIHLKFFVEHQYLEALQEVRHRIAETPGSVDMLNSCHPMNLALQRYDEALQGLDLMTELDPLSPMYHRLRAETLTFAGRYAEARETLNHTARLGMPDPMQYGFLAFMQGNLAELQQQIPMLEQGLGESHLYCLITKARALFLEEKYDEIKVLLAPLQAMAEEKEFHYLQALVAQLSFNKETFLDELDIALTLGEFPAPQNAGLTGIWAERYSDVLDSDRYQGILGKVGLDQESIVRINAALA